MSQRGQERNPLPAPEEYEELLQGLFPRQYPRVIRDSSTGLTYTDLDAPRAATSTAAPQPTLEQAMARERERQRRQMEAQIARQARDPLNLEQDIQSDEALRREPLITTSPPPGTPTPRPYPPQVQLNPEQQQVPSPPQQQPQPQQPQQQDFYGPLLDALRQDQDLRTQDRNINSVTHTNTITTVYKDGRAPQVRRTSTRTRGGQPARGGRGRGGRGRGRGQ